MAAPSPTAAAAAGRGPPSRRGPCGRGTSEAAAVSRQSVAQLVYGRRSCPYVAGVYGSQEREQQAEQRHCLQMPLSAVVSFVSQQWSSTQKAA
eukprot:CAMPEP_0115483920 /NCGR_PEP_ID=MMETSP0271-20121206/59107_1 /TAXON_ID=71861 /ORGANISM="Scrippsiella trochoidea, Strain CCMP3099" /LENGTH=92 /DNA_ID=CAMNT_0002911791 /DNA_START=405 /DNA_END=683 /DNA_ORIENTATION=-